MFYKYRFIVMYFSYMYIIVYTPSGQDLNKNLKLENTPKNWEKIIYLNHKKNPKPQK